MRARRHARPGARAKRYKSAHAFRGAGHGALIAVAGRGHAAPVLGGAGAGRQRRDRVRRPEPHRALQQGHGNPVRLVVRRGGGPQPGHPGAGGDARTLRQRPAPGGGQPGAGTGQPAARRAAGAQGRADALDQRVAGADARGRRPAAHGLHPRRDRAAPAPGARAAAVAGLRRDPERGADHRRARPRRASEQGLLPPVRLRCQPGAAPPRRHAAGAGPHAAPRGAGPCRAPAGRRAGVLRRTGGLPRRPPAVVLDQRQPDLRRLRHAGQPGHRADGHHPYQGARGAAAPDARRAGARGTHQRGDADDVPRRGADRAAGAVLGAAGGGRAPAHAGRAQPARGLYAAGGRHPGRPRRGLLRHRRAYRADGGGARHRAGPELAGHQPPGAGARAGGVLVHAHQGQRRPRAGHLRLLLPPPARPGRLPPPPGRGDRAPVRAGAGARGSAQPHPPAGLTTTSPACPTATCCTPRPTRRSPRPPPPARRWRYCSSTWTGSSRSTIRSAIPAATSCCARSRGACRKRPARRTSSAACPATSS